MTIRTIGEQPTGFSPPTTLDTQPPRAPKEGTREPGQSRFAEVLRALGAEAQRGEATVHDALAATRAGRDLGAAELLVLQVGVYRYSQVIDLAAKLVDHGTSALKNVIQGQ
jgi:hypothetical protein